MKELIKKVKINKYNYYSFDIYDTLIVRNVKKPSDVFKLVEKKYNSENNETISGFLEKRMEAYKIAYEKFYNNCTIDKIYECLNGYDNKQKEILKEIECSIEQDICSPNNEVLKLYEELKKIGKHIVLISDMYFDSDFIKKILNKCGITGYEKIYVSCDYNESKTNGLLYKRFMSDYRLKSNQFMHIGDNIKNDIIVAKILGIDVLHIKNNNKLKGYYNYKGLSEKNKIDYMIQQQIIQNSISLLSNEYESIGFQTVGPLIFGFSKWLYKSLKEKSIKKVYFLAREGNFMKKQFDLINEDKNIESHYLYVSRRSLVVPSYCLNPDFESIVNSLSKSKKVSIKSLIKRWGLNYEDYKDKLYRCGITDNQSFDGRNLTKIPEVKKLFNLLKEDIINNSKKEYDLLVQYLKQENFNGRVAIVDVGWNGSMQLALKKILMSIDKNGIINGYYIGINTSNLAANIGNVNGYVYENERNIINRYLIYGFAGPFELSLTATHGTTIGYKMKNNTVYPVTAKSEYIYDDGSYKNELIYTTKMQSGAEKYIKIAKNIFQTTVDQEVAFRNMKQFGISPKLSHIKLFRNFYANDLGEEQLFVKEKNVGLVKGFWKSTWKFAYMKDLFKLPLPYYKLYVYKRRKID